MKIKLEPGAYVPERAHKTDAGMDIKAMSGQRIMPHSSVVFHTGVHVELPPNRAGLLVSKSGLNINKKIVTTGLIDEGYDGEIVIRMFNHGEESYLVTAGDKISQLVVVPVEYEEIEIVDEIKSGDRGSAGFGSSGR